jgi:hypothetical protein
VESKRLIILSDDKDVEVSESRRRNGECYTGSNSQMLTDLIIASSMVPVGGKRLVPSGDKGDEEPESQKRRKDDSNGEGEHWSSSNPPTSTDMLIVAAMDEDDVTVLDIGDEEDAKWKVDPTADIKHFFRLSRRCILSGKNFVRHQKQSPFDLRTCKGE